MRVRGERSSVAWYANKGGSPARAKVFYWMVVATFGLLLLRLWHLQVIEGEEFRRLCESNRIRLVKVAPLRGRIFDRKGRILADNRPSFDLFVIPEDVKDKESFAEGLAPLLGMPPEEILGKISQRGRSPFQPVRIKGDLTWEELSRIKIRQMELPGLKVSVVPVRTYLYRGLAAHLLGTVGEITREELSRRRAKGYDIGDYLGKTGLEAAWEDYLRGLKGGRQVEVDALGRELRVLREVEPIPGWDLHLTLDLDLQRKAEELLKGKAGAIVALDPSSGAVLAMASAPSYDPAAFARGIPLEMWKKLNEDPLHPLTNRAIRGLYAPGSVFKIVVAAAALAEGRVDPDERLHCGGLFPLGQKVFRCWKEEGHGWMDLKQAIIQSCDIYFYQLGLRVGPELMASYAEAFGFGRCTGIELPGEKAGFVPSPAWKAKRGERWYDGETVVMAIGQGPFLVTPLQMARMIAAVANGGVLYQPLVATEVIDPEGKGVRSYRPRPMGRLPLSPRVLRRLKEALLGVVEDEKGTGRAAHIPGVSVAGKTGTAQVAKMGQRRLKPSELPYELRDHAWFVAYAPAEAPTIAVAVVVEHGGHGGSAAAPLARELIKEWLSIEGEADET
mgnify:CR=1 FL=1